MMRVPVQPLADELLIVSFKPILVTDIFNNKLNFERSGVTGLF